MSGFPHQSVWNALRSPRTRHPSSNFGQSGAEFDQTSAKFGLDQFVVCFSSLYLWHNLGIVSLQQLAQTHLVGILCHICAPALVGGHTLGVVFAYLAAHQNPIFRVVVQRFRISAISCVAWASRHRELTRVLSNEGPSRGVLPSSGLLAAQSVEILTSEMIPGPQAPIALRRAACGELGALLRICDLRCVAPLPCWKLGGVGVRPILTELGPMLATFAPMATNLGPVLAELGPISAKFGPCWPSLPGSSQNRTHFDLIWLLCGDFCRLRPNCQNWADSGRTRTDLAQLRAYLEPISTKFGPMWADFGQLRTDIGQLWTDVGRIQRPVSGRSRADFRLDRTSPNLDRLGPTLGRFRTTRAEHDPFRSSTKVWPRSTPGEERRKDYCTTTCIQRVGRTIRRWRQAQAATTYSKHTQQILSAALVSGKTLRTLPNICRTMLPVAIFEKLSLASRRF